MSKLSILIFCLAACNLGPRVEDAPDAPAPPDAPPKPDGGFEFLLAPGTEIPSIGTDAALIFQIKFNDGITDTAACGTAPNQIQTCLPRGTGKAAGATVRFWNFGPTPVEFNGAIFIAVVAPMYVFGTMEGGVFTPNTHPRLIDTIPGDTRYSAIRRVVNVPLTGLYKGELITSVAALGECVDKGLCGEPVNDGTWVNLPVVLPTQQIEIAAGTPPVTAMPTQVYSRGFKVDVFEIGTRYDVAGTVTFARQPFRSNFVPLGQCTGLQTGVATGGVLPTAIDPALVFQFPIPAAPPGTTFSYSPLCQEIVTRLANGIAPTAITADVPDLYARNATGAMTGFNATNVATFTITGVTNNIQLQFADGFL